MSDSAKSILTYFTLAIVCLFFFFLGLSMAKSFLAPLAVGVLLAMIILPVARWFEKKGIKRGWASLFSGLIIMLFFVLLSGVIAIQVNSFVQDWPQMQKKLEPKINQLQQYISDKTGISVERQEQALSNQMPGGSSGENNQSQNNQNKKNDSTNSSQEQKQENQKSSGSQGGLSGGSILSSAGGVVMQLFSFLGTFLLTFVYIFFFLLYRKKFSRSIIKMAPAESIDSTKRVISKSATVSQDYLFGKILLVVFLAVIYSIGLSISGLKHAILISVLAAFLTMIPYLGNLIGYGLAVGLAFLSGNGLMVAVGVTITFAVTQFVESYILEPYIVGDKVHLNPIFTIIVVVLGNAVWGVVGMLIAIPALGIAKVLFDNIPVLNPIGYLLGEEDMGDDGEEKGFFDKAKNWVLNVFKS